jgi:hypothetical protein
MGGYADNVPPAVAVARLAERQHGVVTRPQLLVAGLGEDQIDLGRAADACTAGTAASSRSEGRR